MIKAIKITKAPPKNTARAWAEPTGLKPETLVKFQGRILKKELTKKKRDKTPELARKINDTLKTSFLEQRLATRKNKRLYKIKLKKVSGSKDIPQKL
ncbi:unnamed protein product [marine sediment metagenome]|uniref:Uncharacterized protein n=1 Tax=marine sediment metagenome TaxID=412755 RepID=X1QX00_9ZZZZ